MEFCVTLNVCFIINVASFWRPKLSFLYSGCLTLSFPRSWNFVLGPNWEGNILPHGRCYQYWKLTHPLTSDTYNNKTVLLPDTVRQISRWEPAATRLTAGRWLPRDIWSTGPNLEHWGRDQFRLRFHWILFLRVPINNIPALIQTMAWYRPGNKQLSEPMLVSLLTHICVTRPQWVKAVLLVLVVVLHEPGWLGGSPCGGEGA